MTSFGPTLNMCDTLVLDVIFFSYFIQNYSVAYYIDIREPTLMSSLTVSFYLLSFFSTHSLLQAMQLMDQAGTGVNIFYTLFLVRCFF